MSMGFIKDGKYVQVAGNPPPSGELVMGASTIRKGYYDLPAAPNAPNEYSSTLAVTFDSPMPDNDYVVEFYNLGTTVKHVSAVGKTKNGFTIHYTVTSSQAATNLPYTAFKLYTVEDVAELEAKVAELEADAVTLGDWVDVSSTASDYTPNNGLYELNGTPIIRYRRMGSHLMWLDARFSIRYLTAVAAGVERQEDYIKFSIPAVLVHGDSFVNIGGYVRGSGGVANPLLTAYGASGGTATVAINAKIWHASAHGVNGIQQFNFNGLVAVERWL